MTTETNTAPRFRTEGDKTCIELHLRRAEQLFETFDPTPFHERDLDDTAADYIVLSLEELPPRTEVRVLIHVGEPLGPSLTHEQITQALHNYFRYKATQAGHELRGTLRKGRYFLAFAVCFLLGCLSLAKLGSALIEEPNLKAMVHEGFTITGWVAMWRPLELLLYDWWPILEKRRVYDRLAVVEVEIRLSEGASRGQGARSA